MKAQDHRTAIITGASGGIGNAMSRNLAEDGIAVVAAYGNDAEGAAKLVKEIQDAGGRALAVQANLSEPSALKCLFDAAEKAFGAVDILVNNAGVMDLAKVGECDDDTYSKLMGVNLDAVFRGMREAANRLRDGGRIINLSSSVVGLYQPGYGIYAATKSAVEALTHVAAKELGERKITVNAIAPGPVGTDLFLAGKTDKQIERVRKMIPFGRLGEPEDIACVVSFLASADGGWVSGQVLRANGGLI